MTTQTHRAGLLLQIEMGTEGLAYRAANGLAPDPMLVAAIERYKAELALLGDNEGADESTPVEARTLTSRPQGGALAANQFGTFQVHYASDKQTAFIGRLLDTRDLASLADSTVIDVARLREQVAKGQVNKKAASAIIDRLLACPEREVATVAGPARVTRPASDKQVAFIKRLAGSRHWLDEGQAPHGWSATVQAVLDGQPVEGRDASAAIDTLLGCADRRTPAAVAPAGPLEAGMYRTADGTLVRVYFGKNSGQMLAKRLDGSAEAGYSFEYMGKADRFVTAADRMSLEEAKAWGRVTSHCCACGAHLDDPTSVEAGIGPVCATKI